MITQLAPREISRPSNDHLEHIAFSGQHEIAHSVFKRLAPDERERYSSKYILSEVIIGGIQHLRKLLSDSAQSEANDEKEFLDDTVTLFIRTSKTNNSFPRELFDSLLRWADELSRLSRLEEAIFWYNEAIILGAKNFPNLYARSLLGKGNALNAVGRFHEAQSLMDTLAERPYMITERQVVPELMLTLAKDSLLLGRVRKYKRLLFFGIRHFYTKMDERKRLVEQLSKTYRRWYRPLIDSEVSVANRVLFYLLKAYFWGRDLRVAKALHLQWPLQYTMLGYIYVLNYFRIGSPHGMGKRGGLKSSDLLITRAMGGIGDLLMMTPGLRALKEKRPDRDIHLAIPRRYFPVFEGNPDVQLIDIEDKGIDHLKYRRWYNLTDCPAARIESRTMPKVKRNRIDIFARALGIGMVHRRKMSKRPRYFLSEEERAFQQKFWGEHRLAGQKVVGIQLYSDEVYRDYPHMEELARVIAQEHKVIVFDAGEICGFMDKNIIKVGGISLRKAFAIASGCDVIVAPDSSFVHFAGAMSIPSVALFGPIDGAVRTKDYPMCTFIDSRQSLGCVACWRNEKIPCALTGMRTSACLTNIPVQTILSAVRQSMTRETLT